MLVSNHIWIFLIVIAVGCCIVMALPLLTSTVSCGALRNDIRNLILVQTILSSNPPGQRWFNVDTFWMKSIVFLRVKFHAIRKLEDKLLYHRLEFRPFFIPMDRSHLHHNREMPCGFTLYLCVGDPTLPAKGTAHRANRNAGKARIESLLFSLFDAKYKYIYR